MSILQAVGSALRFVRGLSTRAAEKVCDSDDVLSGRSLQAFFTAVATLRDSTLEAAGLEWPPDLKQWLVIAAMLWLAMSLVLALLLWRHGADLLRPFVYFNYMLHPDVRRLLKRLRADEPARTSRPRC